MPTINDSIRQIINLPPELRQRWEDNARTKYPEQYKEFQKYLQANPAAPLEAMGYEYWLKRLGSHTFTRPLAPIQHRFWQWDWNALQKVVNGEPLTDKEKIGFLPWPRETGKSSTVEWACIGEGALLKSGYVIYLCGKLSQAIDHVAAIRDRIESEKVAELYSWLSKPKLGTHGNKFGWGQEFLITHGGWAIRPVGADVAMRGGKAINIRPTLIVVDDYDELGDSPHVVEHKEHMLTRAILPMGNANTRVLVPQNPIHENSCVNRMLTGASLALAIRTVFGEIEDDGTMTSRPIPAVRDFAYEVRHTDDGTYSEITKGESNWPGISVTDWQGTLNRVGPEAFMSEYQHDMTVSLEERVLPEYDDRILRLHVITWSQYEAKYGYRRIPSDWPCDLGLDIGYSGQHKSAWTFISKVPQAYELAGSIFRYRGRTFTGVGIDDQAIEIRADLWPDEDVAGQTMSHEKLGEQLTLNRKHGWHFRPCDSAKISGIAQWRHFLRPDRSQPHPFHRDEKGLDGLWRLGRPAWFDIVADDQFIAPRDDAGLKRHRDGAFNWRQVPVKLTDKGLTVEQPAKMDDDECLIAGTMITTGRGEIAIEQVRADDVVLTRRGWKSIERVGLTSPNAEIWTINLSNGLQLSGTKGHPIWVVGCGWKPLSEIGAGEKLLPLTELSFTAIPIHRTGHTERISSHMFTRLKRAWEHFMSSCGSLSTEMFPKVVQFITAITTHSTMPIPILNYLQVLSIPNVTRNTGHPNVLLDSGKSWSECRNWLKNGIEAKKAESGTENTLRTRSVSLQRFQSNANNVEENTSHDGGSVSFAQITASRLISFIEKRWKHHVGDVLTAMRQLIHWPTLSEFGASVVVLRAEKQGRPRPVYNLTVNDCPEYFANSVLVHNCDSTRQILVRFGPSDKPMTQQQKVQAVIPQGYHRRELDQTRHPNEAQMTAEMAEYLAKRQLNKGKRVETDWYGQRI